MVTVTPNCNGTKLAILPASRLNKATYRVCADLMDLDSYHIVDFPNPAFSNCKWISVSLAYSPCKILCILQAKEYLPRVFVDMLG